MKKQLTPLLVIALASAGCGQEPDGTSALPTSVTVTTTVPATASPTSPDATSAPNSSTENPAPTTIAPASTLNPESENVADPTVADPTMVHPTNVTPPPPDEGDGTGDDFEQGFNPDEMVEPGVVRLYVSNQSFAEPTVHLTVKIDGAIIADDDFAVEGQHNFITFDSPVLASGDHELTVESNTGTTLNETFTLPDGEARYIAVDYWYYPDEGEDRMISFHESRIPIMFA